MLKFSIFEFFCKYGSLLLLDKLRYSLFLILFFEIIPMLIEYNNGDDSHLNDIFSEEIISSTQDNILENIEKFIE